MPVTSTIAVSKALLKLSRLGGRGGGSALPGLVAERLDPSIGRELAARIPHGSIIITGTNGKTTTAKMLAQILTDHGERLVTNRAGSNLSRGVVSSLIEFASTSGQFSQTMGLFEVDEAAMPAVCEMVQPKIIVVLNLFRDQLDRYGELDTTARLIASGIAATNAQVYLNADDPLVASLARAAGVGRVTYFGINAAPVSKLLHDVTADSNNCPVCGRALVYSQNFFGHMGHYRCKENHFDRPKPAVAATNIKLEEGAVSGTIALPDKDQAAVTIHLPGLYNFYNALAATAVGFGLGVAPSAIIHSLERVEAAFGRVEKVTVDGRTLYVLLVKNPTGFNQVIQTFLLNKKQQKVWIAINDNFADGRDVSWLWDVAFEELQPHHHQISVSGLRATDMALRLKYADIPAHDVDASIKSSLNQFVMQIPVGGTGYLIPTYTAMLETRRRLGRLTSLKGMWQ
jgi:UDP-N-acetylmuramyl tripeptide synthase